MYDTAWITTPGSQRKLNSALSNKGLDLRVRLALCFLSLLSGNSWENVESGKIDGDELLPLLFRLLGKNEEIFSRLIELSKFTLSKMLTVGQFVDLKVLLNLPMATIRRMRTIFRSFGETIFPSEEKMRREMSNRVQHIEEADMKCEKMFLKPVGVEEDLREIDVLFSGDLAQIKFLR